MPGHVGVGYPAEVDLALEGMSDVDDEGVLDELEVGRKTARYLSDYLVHLLSIIIFILLHHDCRNRRGVLSIALWYWSVVVFYNIRDAIIELNCAEAAASFSPQNQHLLQDSSERDPILPLPWRLLLPLVRVLLLHHLHLYLPRSLPLGGDHLLEQVPAG